MSTPSQSTPTGSKLENASKEDLIKLLKRQQLLLKKSNSENDAAKSALKEKIVSLENQIESSQSSVIQLRQENDDIYSSNKKLTLEFETLQREIEDYKLSITELEKSSKQLKNEREDYLTELEVLRENKEQLKGLLTVIQESEGRLKEQVGSLTSQLETENRDRETEREAWKENISVLQEQIEDSNRKVAEAEKNVSLQKELFSAKNDIASLKSEGDSLKSLIKEYNEQFAMETNTISQVLGALQTSGTSVSSQEDLMADLSDLRRCIKDLELKDVENTERILELTRLNDELRTARNTEVKENVSEGESNNQMEDELKCSKLRVSELEKALKNLEEEKRKIKLHLDEFISENANFKDQKNTEEEMQDQFSEMEHRLEEKENLIRELNSELLTISGELANVQARLVVLSQENEVLEGNLQANQDALDISSREVEKAHEENETLLNEQAEEFRLQTEKMKEEMGSLEAERDTLSSQVFVLEEQVNHVTSELESERCRVETLEHSAKQTARIMSSKEEEISELARLLKEAEETNDRLKEDTKGSHHLMDMELADYQRAADTLQEKLNASKAEVAQLEAELQKKDETVTRACNELKESEKQRSNLDEMISKLKVLLMKAKKEAADAKKSEDDLKIEHEETRMTLEQNIQKLEEMKLELAEVQGELNNLKEFSRKKSEEKSAMLKSMESRFIALQDEVERERELRVEIAGQFESYKVRVHSVLKQQKNNDTVIGISEHEAIVIQLSKELEMVKCQVHELKMSRDSVTSQSEGLEEELSAVIGNLERIERESTEREKFYLERVGELEESVREKEQQIFNNLQSAAAQRAALTDSYTKTLEQNNASHQDASQMLQNRITRLEAELAASVTLNPASSSAEQVETSTPARPPRVRLGAEGMESPVPSSSGLEDILNNPTLSRSSSRISLPDGVQVASKDQDNKISHLSSLLSESEHNAAALQEQCTVLKGEVRRMENMLGNDNTNIEYLKNVVMKYLSSEPTAREQLVPVLSTVLKLNKEEVSSLSSSASVGKREQVPWTSTWFYSST
ncbi:hypothetical protein ACHWQZ_G014158 [Mnemiopsis leidyi]